jgi:spermidine synthase
MGALTLRRRRSFEGEYVYEMKLGDEFLMSSRFTASEVALAQCALAEVEGADLDVLVGGLGLGYTARAVLEDARVRSLIVMDALPAVIEWHERGMLPLSRALTSDPRCRLTHGDFFASIRSAGEPGIEGANENGRFHAILVDIDHSPRQLLHPSHAFLYETDGLRRIARRLRPHGVFALWSNDGPDERFLADLAGVLPAARAETVSFHNPLQNRMATQTIYLGKQSARAGARWRGGHS